MAGAMTRSDKDSNREFYNSEREDDRRRFDEEPLKRLAARTIVSWIAGHLEPGDRMLDVAGGSGVYASGIVRAAPVTVVGLDISDSMVRQRSEDPELELNVVGDMESLPFASGSFDAVMFVACLHHVPDSLPSLREALRVLRPGGQLFAYEPCSIHARRRGVEPVPGFSHEFRISMAHLAGRIRAAGFDLDGVSGKLLTARLLERAVRRPSFRAYLVTDRIDRALTLVPRLGRLGKAGMFRASRPGAAPRVAAAELSDLLACPRCCGRLSRDDSSLACRSCGAVYAVSGSLPVLLADRPPSGPPVG